MNIGRPERGALNMLLLTAAFALAAHARHLPLWILLACAAAGVWRFGMENLAWPAPRRLLRLGITLLVVAATIRHYGTLIGRDAGTGLLAALLALKLLELARPRDAVVAVLLCLLLLLASFLYEQSPPLALYGLLVVLASIVTLLALQRAGARDFAYNWRLGGLLVLKAVPLALAMFFLFPRAHGNLWGLPADVYGAFTGLSEIMQPGSINRLISSNALAFRVEFEGEVPRATQMYWRALVLWQTDGQRWTRGEPSGPPSGHRQLERFGPPVKYTVTLEPNDKPWMFLLDLPIAPPVGARARPGFVFEHPRAVRERYSYTAISYPRHRTGPLEPSERRHALQLPAKLSPRVQALAREWRRTKASELAVAQAALDYFRREPFFYTLDPPLLGPDPVDEFLFSTRRGFCGHFAAAFVTLMRAAGIPSRVVQGYLGGEFNAAGNYWMVRQADAHAWAEIWLPGEGWVRMDPTAAVAPERVELGIDAVRELALRGVDLGRLPTEAVRKLIELGWFARSWHRTRMYWDAANLSWYRWVIGYDRQRQELLLSRLRMPRLSWQGLLLTLALVLLSGLLVLAALMRRTPRRDPVLLAYERFCRRLGRLGIHRGPAEGPTAFAERAAVLRPDLQPSVDGITALYLQLRYARTPKAELRSLRRRIAHFRPPPRASLADTEA